MRFKETGVKEIVSRVLLPLWNSYRFFSEQSKLHETNFGHKLVPRTKLQVTNLPNIMDRWILSNCQSLLKFMEQEMAGMKSSSCFKTWALTCRLKFSLPLVYSRATASADD